MRKIKIILIHILTLSFITISNANASRDIYKQVRKNQSLINDVYRHIITNYVDDIDLDAFTKMSINNMLLELDPYTTYMEKEEKDGIEMLTKGKYGGVGIQIGLREKQLTVISPMDQSPAKRAGILSGDKIIKIDGQETADFNIDDAAKLIRGKKGTEVVLSIQRYGEIELIDFVLTRETIPVKDISYSGMLNENPGYIRLTRFSRNSDKEMRSDLKVVMDRFAKENHRAPTYEDFLSAKGITYFYKAFSGESNTNLSSEEILLARRDDYSLKTIEVLNYLLSSYLRYMALVWGAHGGVLLSGSIVKSLLLEEDYQEFRNTFEDSETMRDFMRAVPLAIVLIEEIGYVGGLELSKKLK